MVCVQGASRGLGLSLVKRLLTFSSARVVGTCRNKDPQDLFKLRDQFQDRLQVVSGVDLTDKDAGNRVLESLENVSHLNLLINAGGVLHNLKEPGQESKILPEKSINEYQFEWAQFVMQVNCLGTLNFTKSLLPFLIRGGEQDTSFPAVLASISAKTGSIEDNHLGGWYSYRMSKAALNMGMKTLAIEMKQKRKNVSVMCLHPGTVQTNMSEPFQKNVKPEKLFTPDQSAQYLLQVLHESSVASNGQFLAYDGSQLPW